MSKPIVNPLTGKVNKHDFKMKKRAQKQAHYDLKAERIINDNGSFIVKTTQTQIMSVLTQNPVQAKKTVLHTKTCLLPALANTQRALSPYRYTLAEQNTALVRCESREMILCE